MKREEWKGEASPPALPSKGGGQEIVKREERKSEEFKVGGIYAILHKVAGRVVPSH